jgi:hypothetical protein
MSTFGASQNRTTAEEEEKEAQEKKRYNYGNCRDPTLGDARV